MRIPRTILVLAAAALVACTSQKEPAENAVAKVESSLNEVRADAQQYAADQLQKVDASVTRMKSMLSNKDYRRVVLEAPGVASAIDELKSTVAGAKANAEATLAAAQTEWNELNAAVQPLVEKLQMRVDELNKSRKYPKGMDKAAFEAAKSGFEQLKNEWTEAGSEFAAGQAANAVRKARNAKARAEELMNTLQVQV